MISCWNESSAKLSWVQEASDSSQVVYHVSALWKEGKRLADHEYYFTWIFKEPQETVGEIRETAFVHPLRKLFVECYQLGGKDWGFRTCRSRFRDLCLTWYWGLVPRWNPRTHSWAQWTLDQFLLTSCHFEIRKSITLSVVWSTNNLHPLHASAHHKLAGKCIKMYSPCVQQQTPIGLRKMRKTMDRLRRQKKPVAVSMK